jgi:hypothetical protein
MIKGAALAAPFFLGPNETDYSVVCVFGKSSGCHALAFRKANCGPDEVRAAESK